jgi:hypothetical protein
LELEDWFVRPQHRLHDRQFLLELAQVLFIETTKFNSPNFLLLFFNRLVNLVASGSKISSLEWFLRLAAVTRRMLAHISSVCCSFDPRKFEQAQIPEVSEKKNLISIGFHAKLVFSGVS